VTALAKLSRIVLICRNAERLVAFYRRAFGFVPCDAAQQNDPSFAELIGRADGEAWITTLRLGNQVIALAEPRPPGRTYPLDVAGWDPRFQHFAIVVSDMAAAYARLQGVREWTPISISGPQALPATSGGVTAFKFRDPEGHPLELLAYAANARPTHWAFQSDHPGLGIDHSAISVADSGRSMAFYSGLGLARVGGSLNSGPEQQKLDNVSDAIVEVTALASPSHPTPHVELLCYRGIFDRRTLFADPEDVAATQLAFEVDGDTFDKFVASERAAIVAGSIKSASGELRVLLRDPDGHLLCVERAGSRRN
jgi:catechol 2,3-dioxygenase-like lactoylglutathione lyase family enzyme